MMRLSAFHGTLFGSQSDAEQPGMQQMQVSPRKRANSDSEEDPPMKRSSVVERFRKLRIREETVDDVILPMKLARLSPENDDFAVGTFGGFGQVHTPQQQEQELDAQEYEHKQGHNEDHGATANLGFRRASIPLPPLSELIGSGSGESRSTVDQMIEELIRRDYLRHKIHAMQHSRGGYHGVHSQAAEDERKAEEMAEGFSKLTVKATHAGDLSHSDWFFEAAVDDDQPSTFSMSNQDMDIPSERQSRDMYY